MVIMVCHIIQMYLVLKTIKLDMDILTLKAMMKAEKNRTATPETKVEYDFDYSQYGDKTFESNFRVRQSKIKL